MAKSPRTDTQAVVKLVIDGKQSEASLKELNDTARKLRTEFLNMKEAADPAAYRKLREEYNRVNDAIGKVTETMKRGEKQSSLFQKAFGSIAGGVFGGNMLTRAWDLAQKGIVGFITKNAELSDQMAGVQKTTGLTEQAVDRLNQKFKTFDTRTPKEQLLGLAQVAGKLGISAEKDVEGFVRAADKIGVALGEDLGGTEEALNSIGKLIDIFKINDQYGLEDSILKVGSAINDLGASGTANEKYLIEFTQRLAGIAPAANISITDVMGLGATLDELGQNAESASTAVGQFIVGMGKDIPKYAQIAKMSVGDFSKLLKDDANEAFLRVLASSESAGGGIQTLAENMGLIGVAGARGVASLGVLAENVDKLRSRQDLASKSFADGTSILNEFNTVNNNLAGNLQKLQNQLASWWEISDLRQVLTDFTGWLAGTANETNKLSNAFFNQRDEVDRLERDITPLLDRYEELKSKSELSKDEHIELNKIINTISANIPTAATEFDKYGNVIAISTTKAKEFIEAQKALLQYQNREAILSAKKDLKEYSDEVEKLKRELNQGYKESELSKFFFGDAREFKLTDKMRTAMVDRLQQMGQLKKGAEELLKTLSGEDIEVKVVEPIKPEGNGNSDNGNGNKTKEQLAAEKAAQKEREAAAKRALQDYKKLIDEYNALDAARLMEQMSKNEREKSELAKKYDDEIKKYKEFLNQKGVSDAQRADITGKIKDLEANKDKAVKELEIRQENEYVNTVKKLREGLAIKYETERQKEISRINQFYDKLLDEARGNADMEKQINADRAKELADAEIREKERLKEYTKGVQRETAIINTDYKTRRLQEIDEQYARELEALKQKFSDELQQTEEFQEAKKALEDKYRAERKEAEAGMTDADKKALAIDTAKNIGDAVFDIAKNNRDAELAATLANIDKQREAELANKNLTEQQKKQINDKYDAQEKAAKRKAWQADKKAALTKVFIETALNVVKAFPNVFQMAAAGALGVAQAAVISSQKPPQYARGGLLPEGPSHAAGGLKIIDSRTGRTAGEIEGGEPILSRRTYANNREIVDQLLYSSMRQNGARVQISPDIMNNALSGRSGGSAMTAAQPVVNVTAPSPDFSPLTDKLDVMINAFNNAQSKEVVLSMRALHDKEAKLVKLQNENNA